MLVQICEVFLVNNHFPIRRSSRDLLPLRENQNRRLGIESLSILIIINNLKTNHHVIFISMFF